MAFNPWFLPEKDEIWSRIEGPNAQPIPIGDRIFFASSVQDVKNLSFSQDPAAWFSLKLTSLGHVGVEGTWRSGFAQRFKYAAGRSWGESIRPGGFTTSAMRLGVRGALSSFLPITPVPERSLGRAGVGAVLRDLSERGIIGGSSSLGVRAGKAVLRGAGKGFLGAIGPIMVGYRLNTELGGGMSVGAQLDRAVRIIGEEAAYGAGGALGLAIGGAIGSAAMPVVGTAIGMVAGAVIGSALGGVWNSAVDLAEAPIRYGYAGLKFFEGIGKSLNAPELGGRVSFGNSTQIAATMRQRALLEINRSGINARSLLGREAVFLHS